MSLTDQNSGTTPYTELTLDPQDWDEFRRQAHRMLDESLDFLMHLDQQPAWQDMPHETENYFEERLPQQGQGLSATYEAFKKHILPYTNGNRHPRFFGWVQGNGTPLGMLAEMLATAMNPHMAGFNQAPKLVEAQVIRWLAGVMGFPSSATGVLVTGGTMANVLALAVARNHTAGPDYREKGLQLDERKYVVYGSSETHVWAQKACEFLGLGNAAFRQIAVDDDFRLIVNQLSEQIARDRKSGLVPLCAIGTAGTVNTGAIDPLDALADLCKQEDIWFHVDGAFGAMAAFSPKQKSMLNGMERADSLAFDLHKWGYLPFEVACVLVRDGEHQRAAFESSPSYIAASNRGVIGGGLPFANLGMDLTRNFKALKVWMTFKAEGAEKMGRLIKQNIDQAQWLAAEVEAEPELELLAPAPLNIVCFRYLPKSTVDDTDALNQEILLQLQEKGIAIPSSTILHGKFAIRACFVNHRTKARDVQQLLQAVLDLGRELSAKLN